MAITISGKGTRVHAWRRSGELEWETAIGEAPIVAPTSSQLPSVKKRDTADAYGNAIDAFVTTGSSPALVVLANNRVARLDVASGEELWTADLDTEEPVSEANDSSVVNLFRCVLIVCTEHNYMHVSIVVSVHTLTAPFGNYCRQWVKLSIISVNHVGFRKHIALGVL